jgi:hypothetical protein
MSSKVTDNTGKIVEVQDLSVSADKIYNFVQLHKTAYFEDHSLEWALDEIIARGCAEITRQVKTARKLDEQRKAAKVLEAFNLSPIEAQLLLAKLRAEQVKQQTEAKKAENDGTGCPVGWRDALHTCCAHTSKRMGVGW